MIKLGPGEHLFVDVVDVLPALDVAGLKRQSEDCQTLDFPSYNRHSSYRDDPA